MRSRLRFEFSPMDTWFFKRPGPHDAVGASRLESQFPPPVGTVHGAIRSRLGDALEINWAEHANGGDNTVFGTATLSEIVGNGADAGCAVLEDLYMSLGVDRLYPAPATLITINDEAQVYQLRPGTPVCCDIGGVTPDGRLAAVTLPQAPKGGAIQALSGGWLRKDDFEKALSGKRINYSDVLFTVDLLCREERLGIGRNARNGTVIDGLLYQTSHLRFIKDVCIVAELTVPHELKDVLIESFEKDPIVRLGGEGRMASVQITPCDENTFPGTTTVPSDSQGFMIYAVDRFLAEPHHAPVFLADFAEMLSDDSGVPVKYWRGVLHGVALDIHCLVTPKIERQAGWDLQRNAPKASQSWLQPGTVWFATPVSDSTQEAVVKLHGTRIQFEQNESAARIACCAWQ